MDGVFETQPDRTDLPLVVMPVVIESMIGPFKQNFTMLENVARVRMYEDFTLDEDTSPCGHDLLHRGPCGHRGHHHRLHRHQETLLVLVTLCISDQ